ncbi:MAG: hypothetical protein IH950_15640, partial [Bacteroidetes bacterium]|nr:hypothetical protein [Bacteroidota bacterium]
APTSPQATPTPLSPTLKINATPVALNILRSSGVSEEEILARFPDKKINKEDAEKFLAERSDASIR